jgi:Zn-dependent protease with chaperone function
MRNPQLARVLAIVLLAATGLAHAQTLTWSARMMLAESSAPRIDLQSQGRTVDQVSREAVARALEVTHRLAAALEMPAPEVYIARQSGPNAFAKRNVYGEPVVGISTEMLRLAGHDEAALATVVGHELGHVKASHVGDSNQRAGVIGLLGTLLGAAVDIGQARQGRNTWGLGTVLGSVGAHLVNAKFSRDQEREADELGVRAMAKAGYNPVAAGRIWQLLAQRRDDGAGLWFDSHPSHPEREQAMATLAQQLQPVYLANARAQEAPGVPAALVGPVPIEDAEGLSLLPPDSRPTSRKGPD